MLVLLGRAEPHDVFDASAIVPAAVEDHDFSGSRKMRRVTLHEHLRLFAVGWCGESDHAEHARAHSFRNRLDRPAFAGGIASLEYDDGARSLGLHPLLQMTKLDLKLAQLFLVSFSFHPGMLLLLGHCLIPRLGRANSLTLPVI